MPSTEAEFNPTPAGRERDDDRTMATAVTVTMTVLSPWQTCCKMQLDARLASLSVVHCMWKKLATVLFIIACGGCSLQYRSLHVEDARYSVVLCMWRMLATVLFFACGGCSLQCCSLHVEDADYSMVLCMWKMLVSH